jgi:hypothetical protein
MSSEEVFAPPPSQLTNKAAEILHEVLHILNPPASVVGTEAWRPYFNQFFAKTDQNLKVYLPYSDGVIGKKYFVWSDELRRMDESAMSMGFRNGGITHLSVHPTGPHSAIATYYQHVLLGPNAEVDAGNHPRSVQIRVDPLSGLITEIEETWHSAALQQAFHKLSALTNNDKSPQQ